MRLTKKNVFAVGAMALVAATIATWAMREPSVTVSQKTVYPGVFDVEFESRQQVEDLISESGGRQGDVLLRHGITDSAHSFSEVYWYAQGDSGALLRLRWFLSETRDDSPPAKEDAEAFEGYLSEIGISGVVSVAAVPIVECHWNDEAWPWTEWYLEDMVMAPSSNERGVRPGRAEYQLLGERQKIDCWNTFRKHREFLTHGTLDAPVPASVSNTDMEPTPLPQYLRSEIF